MIRLSLGLAAALLAGAFGLLAGASGARADFASCKEGLKADAVRAGVSAATAASALDPVAMDPKILELENVQPEFKTPIWDYVAALADDERVADGKKAMAEHMRALDLAQEKFGVSKYAIAAIWGVESNFGDKPGGRPLVQSLSTLACSPSKRPAFFRGELMAALKIVDRGDIPLEKLKGSWAGAFGQTQFMPSTFLRLAVDLDGTGKDIVDNASAALGSTANYLRKSGWETGEPWLIEAKLPGGYDGPSGRRNRHPMSFWAGRGLTRIDGRALSGPSAGLLLPTGPKGPAFLVTKNFDAIYSYNAAESYALAAAILAQRLAGGPGIETPWPTDDPPLSRAERREVQALLAKKGYDVGAPDGEIGTKSKAAIADFQGKAGMEANGRASTRTLERLRR
jgi:lytic murein transglycosylase